MKKITGYLLTTSPFEKPKYRSPTMDYGCLLTIDDSQLTIHMVHHRIRHAMEATGVNVRNVQFWSKEKRMP